MLCKKWNVKLAEKLQINSQTIQDIRKEVEQLHYYKTFLKYLKTNTMFSAKHLCLYIYKKDNNLN